MIAPPTLHRFPIKVRALCWTIVTSALYGCGGGGGSSESDSTQLSVSTTNLAVTADTSSGGAVLYNPLTFSVSKADASTYYYSIAYVGVAIGGIATNGVTSSQQHTGNPTVGSAAKLAPAIGRTINGVLSGTSGSMNNIIVRSPSTMGAGTYHDTITISVCYDSQCTRQVPRSPQTVAFTYNVTGDRRPITSVTVTPNILVEATSNQTAAPTTSVALNAINIPSYGAYVSATYSGSGVVTGLSFQSAATRTDGVADGTITATLANPSGIGNGVYTDTLTVNVCFDVSCSNPARGSPWTVNVVYIVESTSGVDFQQKAIPINVIGMAWSAFTQRIYVVVPSYSPLSPNTIAQIDPYNGMIDATAPLHNAIGGTLVASENGQYLYVATRDSVQRMRTSDLVTDLIIPLSGNQSVEVIKVAPGAPQTIAVKFSNPPSSLTIFDNAIPRGQSITDTNTELLSSFSWGSTSSNMFVHMNAILRSTVVTTTASSFGLSITQTSVANTSPDSSLSGDMQFSNGFLYWDGGGFFDTTTNALSTPFSITTPSKLTLDNLHNRAYFLTTEQPIYATSRVVTLHGFELSTRKPLWLARFPSQNFSRYLTRWGNDGLAFTTSSATDSLILISGSIVTQ